MALPPDSGAILNTTLDAFDNALAVYLPPLVTWGERIFEAIVFVGFGYAMICAWANRDWMGSIQSLGWAALRFCLIRVVFQNFIPWAGAFPAMGVIVGSNVSGVSSSIGPSDVYALGNIIILKLLSALHIGLFFWAPFHVLSFFALLIAATKIIWFASALVFLWIILESKWIIATGAVPLAFSGIEHGFVILEHYAVVLVQVGIKLLVTFLVLAVGITLSNIWVATISAAGWGINTNQVGWGITELLEALIFFFALWGLPRKAAALVRSSGSGGDPSGSGGAEGMWEFGAGAVTANVSRAISAGVRAGIRAVKG